MNTRTQELMHCAVAAVAGAALMYLLDPEQGKRRRALLRDRVVAGRHDIEDFVQSQGTRAMDHARGLAEEARTQLSSRVSEDETVPDDRTIAERIRARMGRVVSHPGAIEVAVVEGRARLSGDILTSEREALLSVLREMPEVRDIDDQLNAYEQAGNIPSLQG